MTPTAPLGAFGNLLGLDGILILGVQAAFVLGLVWLVRSIARGSKSNPAGRSPEARLQKLDAMRGSGVISETEYQEQRRRILSQV